MSPFFKIWLLKLVWILVCSNNRYATATSDWEYAEFQLIRTDGHSNIPAIEKGRNTC